MLYAAKCYWPGVTSSNLEQVAERAAEAGLGTGRDRVAYLVLCLFQGPSRAAVIRASGRLGIPCERVMDSAWLGPGLPSQEEGPPRSPPSGRRAWPRGPANCD